MEVRPESRGLNQVEPWLSVVDQVEGMLGSNTLKH